jgi:hypothetical protein
VCDSDKINTTEKSSGRFRVRLLQTHFEGSGRQGRGSPSAAIGSNRAMGLHENFVSRIKSVIDSRALSTRNPSAPTDGEYYIWIKERVPDLLHNNCSMRHSFIPII